MHCPQCPSDNQVEVVADMVVHFSGLKHLNNPGVRVSSQLLICLDCGFSSFTVPETELPLLAKGAQARETMNPDLPRTQRQY